VTKGATTMSNDPTTTSDTATGPATTGLDLTALVSRLDALQQRVDRLEAELEAAQLHHGPVPIDTILAISAAVAAYLGKKATVRQIHYSHNDPWARLGRSAVHASHTISRRMG
jgi:methylmalonyl-CoA carboxyltransferase large subunit